MERRRSCLNKPIPRVAVIGAGISGLTTAKACLESNLPVDVYEYQANLGGVWRFREKVEHHIGSVMHCTIVNSSKEMTAFSDFPVPEEYPNFMHNKFMIQYIEDYVEKFCLKEHIRFEHCVEDIQPSGDGYLLKIRFLKDRIMKELYYDAVAICTGHNHTPKWPAIDGMDRFTGVILHSHQVRTTESFRNKTVVVVGVGNSGGDIAADLAPICEQVYLSSRRGGTWLIRRCGSNGYPVDTQAQRRIVEGAMSILPLKIQSRIVEALQQKLVGHRLLGLKPRKTRFFSQHIMVNDILPTAIHLGQVKMRDGIERFTTNGVLFVGEKQATACDAVIFATGYKLAFPFVSASLLKWNDSGRIALYKHVFHPHQTRPERLAFIGLTQPIGSLPPIAEIQARWFVGLLTGHCPPLPAKGKMLKEIRKRRESIIDRYGTHNGDRYTFQADWLSYMDTIAKRAGFSPNVWHYALTDPKLWWALLTKPAIAAQFRLNGAHSKHGQARSLILNIERRIECPYKRASINLK